VVGSDPAPAAEARLRARVDEFWATLETLGLDDGASRKNLVFAASVADAVRDAELVQENGPERLEIKRSLLAEIESALAEEALIATSTSGRAAQGHARPVPEPASSGGDGGITRVLRQFSMREFARTLGDYPATDDYIEVIGQGVAEELAGYDWQQMLHQRDQLVVQLLAAKKEQPQVP
jgi:hypothetical protein